MQRTHLIILLLAAVVVAAFGRICTHEFIPWDDMETLSQNTDVSPPAASHFVTYWRKPYMGLYVPITYTVWEALAYAAQTDQPDDEGSHLNPWVYHTASVAVHLLSVLVVFALLRELLGRDGPAALGAILFAVHPLQVESVAWASGMKDLLCGLFTLLAVWQYVLWAKHASTPAQHQDRRRESWRYGLVCLAMVLGVLSKPTAVVTPLLAGVIDYWMLRRPAKTVLKSLAPLLLLAIPCILWARHVQYINVRAMAIPPLWTRPLVAGFSLSFYLFKLVLPFNLIMDYGHSPPVLLHGWWIYVAWVVPAALALALWRGRSRYPALVASAGALVAGILPVLGLSTFQFQAYSTVADHYMYLAMLGPALAVGWLMTRHWTRRGVLVCVVVLVGLAVRTINQAGNWQDGEVLLTHVLKLNPRSFAAHNNLASQLGWHNERLAEAAAHIEAAIQAVDALPPEVPRETYRAHGAVGQSYLKMGRPEAAIPHFQHQLRVKPDDKEAAENLRKAQEKLGQKPPAASAGTRASPATAAAATARDRDPAGP